MKIKIIKKYESEKKQQNFEKLQEEQTNQKYKRALRERLLEEEQENRQKCENIKNIIPISTEKMLETKKRNEIKNDTVR